MEGFIDRSFALLSKSSQKKRTGKVIQFAVSSPKNHNKKLKFIVAGGHSTLNDNPISLGDFSNKTTTVTCKTLDSILEDNKVLTAFDFISVDNREVS